MGRRYAGRLAILAATGAALALGMAGCTSVPPGVDRNLTNNWPAMPAPKVSVPTAGACFSSGSSGGFATGNEPTVPCTGSHAIETVYVGAFTGADADRSDVPEAGNPARVTAYAECRKNAAAYLGDDYAMGILELTLVTPYSSAWRGGARWFRCDVTRYADLQYSKTVGDGSVKDGLRGERPLAITCLLVTDDGKGTVNEEQAVSCSQPHNAELAGLFTAPDLPWSSDDKARRDMAQKGCEGIVAQYLGLSGGHVTNPVLGWGWEQFAQERWNLGDRTVRCTVMAFKGDSVNGARYSGSVKGIGNKAPKA